MTRQRFPAPPNAKDPSINPFVNHLKPTGTSVRFRFSLRRDAIDHATGNHRLSDRAVAAPVWTVCVQICYRGRQIVVRIHQPSRRRDDAVAVRIRIVGKGDVELVTQGHEFASSRTAKSNPFVSCRPNRPS